jgi:hypothetical protein
MIHDVCRLQQMTLCHLHELQGCRFPTQSARAIQLFVMSLRCDTVSLQWNGSRARMRPLAQVNETLFPSVEASPSPRLSYK